MFVGLFFSYLTWYEIFWNHWKYLYKTIDDATLTFKDSIPLPYWGMYINPSDIRYCFSLKPFPSLPAIKAIDCVKGSSLTDFAFSANSIDIIGMDLFDRKDITSEIWFMIRSCWQSKCLRNSDDCKSRTDPTRMGTKWKANAECMSEIIFAFLLIL